MINHLSQSLNLAARPLDTAYQAFHDHLKLTKQNERYYLEAHEFYCVPKDQIPLSYKIYHVTSIILKVPEQLIGLGCGLIAASACKVINFRDPDFNWSKTLEKTAVYCTLIASITLCLPCTLLMQFIMADLLSVLNFAGDYKLLNYFVTTEHKITDEMKTLYEEIEKNSNGNFQVRLRRMASLFNLNRVELPLEKNLLNLYLRSISINFFSDGNEHLIPIRVATKGFSNNYNKLFFNYIHCLFDEAKQNDIQPEISDFMHLVKAINTFEKLKLGYHENPLLDQVPIVNEFMDVIQRLERIHSSHQSPKEQADVLKKFVAFCQSINAIDSCIKSKNFENFPDISALDMSKKVEQPFIFGPDSELLKFARDKGIGCFENFDTIRYSTDPSQFIELVTFLENVRTKFSPQNEIK